MTAPTATDEIRLISLRSITGANFWSPRPVTRLDLAIGAYEHVSSAEVPGLTDRLLAAIPGLIEHRCNIGERGGFVTRLRRGTYVPHIIEHVGLELQTMAGHDVGYGRARGGDRTDEYTVVFEHRHAKVGRHAAAVALEIVRDLFDGLPVEVDRVVRELVAISRTADLASPQQRIICGILAGTDGPDVRREILHLRPGDDSVVEVANVDLLQIGLSYAASETAVIFDARRSDLPRRYGEPDSALRLASVVACGVPRGGVVVVPASNPALQAMVTNERRRVATFSPLEASAAGAALDVVVHGYPRDGRIMIETGGRVVDGGGLHDGAPLDAQVAAAVAVHVGCR
jgi:hypothetical protein